jgi:hypothetical protein
MFFCKQERELGLPKSMHCRSRCRWGGVGREKEEQVHRPQEAAVSSSTPCEEVPEEHVTVADSSSSEDEEGEGAHEEGAYSASSGSSSVYLRGPVSLP